MKLQLTVATLSFLALCGCDETLPSGTISPDEPIVLTEKDSGRVFRGAADGSTVLSAGIEIGGWKDEGRGVWSAPIPKGKDGQPIYFESLFVNGRRASRARIPDKGFVQVAACKQVVHKTKNPFEAEWRLTLKPSEAKLFAQIDPEELKYVQAVCHKNWDALRRVPSAYDAAEGVLVLPGIEIEARREWAHLVPTEQYFFENVRTGFNAPGEWFYDAANGKVSYRPLKEEVIRSAIAPKPGFATLVKIDGAKNVRFENITFAYTSPYAKPGASNYEQFQGALMAPNTIEADNAEGIVFENCRFEHVGGYAVAFRANCRSNAVRRCRMTDLGAGGVRIGLFDARSGEGALHRTYRPETCIVRPPAATAFNEVSDTYILHCGRFYESGMGVMIGHASDNLITHNEIADLYYTGISVGWVWGYNGSEAQRNEISYNLIHEVGQKVLSDMGGIYTLGTSFGTRIANNTIYNVYSYTYGGWGLYNDEGSEGIVMENNLVYHTKDSVYHQHYGRHNILRNNILAQSTDGQFAVSSAEPHLSVTVENNIFYWERGDFFNQGYSGTKPGGKAKVIYRNNQFCCRDGEGTCRFNGKTLAEWKAAGGDPGAIECDALLVDPDAGNYRVRPDAKAMTIGFKRFDPFEAGVREDYSSYRYPQQKLTPDETARKKAWEELPPVTDDGKEALRPEIRNGTWYVNGKPEYYLGVWLYNRTNQWGPNTNPLKIDHFAYTERPGTNVFPRMGFNSSQLSCAHTFVGQVLHGNRPACDWAQAEAEIDDFYRGFGDMPMAVDFAFGYHGIYPKPVRVALDQQKCGWHAFIPLCPENPEGDAYYRDFFVGGVKSALKAGSNVYLWELFNESAWNCECKYNRRDFAARMVKKYGSIAAVNAKWGTSYADEEAIAAADGYMANPASWYDWCVFSATRYNEILMRYRKVIEGADKRKRVYFTEQAAGCPPVHRCMDLRGADALEVLALEGGWGYGKKSNFVAKNDMEAVVATRGSRHFYNCDFYQALTKGRKVIVNDEHYCTRIVDGKRVPSKRTDYITSLWLETMHGVSANFTYVWDKRCWETPTLEAARKNVERPSYRSSSLLNPFNVKPEDLCAFKMFQDELAPYKEKLLPFPRVKPATVAVFFSKPTQIQRNLLPPVEPNRPLWQDQPDMTGVWYVRLLHALYPVKVVFEEDLDALGPEVEALVVPGAQYVLPEVVDKMRAFEKRGGLVVTAKDSLSFDAWAKPLGIGRPFVRVANATEALACLDKKGVTKYAAIEAVDSKTDPIQTADVQICDRGDFKLVCAVDLAAQEDRTVALKLLFRGEKGTYRAYDPVAKKALGTYTVADLAAGKLKIDLPAQCRVLIELTKEN